MRLRGNHAEGHEIIPSRETGQKGSKHMPKLFVGLVLAIVLSVAGLVLANASMSQYLTAFISLAALTVSVVSAFKEDLFPFHPAALFEEIVLAATTAPSHDSPAILMPITFMNKGHGSGVIEGLTLKVELGESAKIYTPVVEVDLQKFMSGKHALHGENVLGAFNLFPIGARESMKKHIVFSQEETSKRYPFSSWTPGKYVFRLFAKHTGSRSPVDMGNIEMVISDKMLSEYKTGTSTSLAPTRELHV